MYGTRTMLLGALVAGLSTFAGPAGAQSTSIDVEPVTPTTFQRRGEEIRVYSAKLVCGDPSGPAVAVAPGGPPLAPGFYLTAINIHNPDPDNAVTFNKKVAEALPERLLPTVGQVSERVTETLGPDQAMEVDCADAFMLLGRDGDGEPEGPGVEAVPRGFLKGFVVVETRGRPNAPPLDIVGVYTVIGGRSGGIPLCDLNPRDPLCVCRLNPEDPSCESQEP